MLSRIVSVLEAQPGRFDTSSLRIMFASGSQLEAELVRRTQRTIGDVLYNFYASTEVGLGDVRHAGGPARRAGMRRAPALRDRACDCSTQMAARSRARDGWDGSSSATASGSTATRGRRQGDDRRADEHGRRRPLRRRRPAVRRRPRRRHDRLRRREPVSRRGRGAPDNPRGSRRGSRDRRARTRSSASVWPPTSC